MEDTNASQALQKPLLSQFKPSLSNVSTLIDGAPTEVVQDIIEVDNETLLWPEILRQRHKTSQTLFNRFYSQIIHGCSNPKCTTPTCLSSQKRASRGPFRSFTELSTLTLTTFLASQENPEKNLCSHPPAENPKAGSTGEVEMKQEKKDPKSFTQNMSDTDALRSYRNSRAPEQTFKCAVQSAKGGTTTEDEATDDPLHSVAEENVDRESRQNREALQSMQDLNSSEIRPKKRDLRDIRSPETLSHFTPDNIKALHQMVVRTRKVKPLSSRHLVIQCLTAFAAQSITYVLSSPAALLSSFRYSAISGQGSNGTLDFHRIISALHTLHQLDPHPRNVFPSLWVTAGHLYFSAPCQQRQSNFKTLRQIPKSPNENTLEAKIGDLPSKNSIKITSDRDACHIVQIILAALISSIPLRYYNLWKWVRLCHSTGQRVPAGFDARKHPKDFDELQLILDAFEDEIALDLMARLIKAIATRMCAFEISSNHSVPAKDKAKTSNDSQNVIEMLIDSLVHLKSTVPERNFLASAYPVVLLEWLKCVLLKKWTGKAEVSRFDEVGGALQIMSYLHRESDRLGLDPECFVISFLSGRLDDFDLPIHWLSHQANKKSLHLLSFPFIFSRVDLIAYFRACNYAAMSKAYGGAIQASRLLDQMSFGDSTTGRGVIRSESRLGNAFKSYLVIEVNRKSILVDALNQLWRREKRELMKPLKVRMGMDEGEEGIDHGGVQQEFFRIAIAEALNPDYGVFMTDEQIHMSWFRPGSLEFSFKLELVGLLFGLAVYNGLTLPVTMPLAFYRKLLGLPVTDLEHIQDGWPQLAKGMSNLLDWKHSDVEDVFIRSYVFSTETTLGTVYVDMEHTSRDEPWPIVDEKYCYQCEHAHCHSQSSDAEGEDEESSIHTSRAENGDDKVKIEVSEASSEDMAGLQRFCLHSTSAAPEPSMVTNQNRKQYVSDYIFWLTDKSIRPQFEAFARGFFICVSRKAISMFTPKVLKDLVEGSRFIDVGGLQEVTHYEGGFMFDDHVISNFWSVVREFSQDQLRLLLEFVTASDRVPAGGIGSTNLAVQKNGDGDERLPTSLTCFAKLLLPAYTSKEVLKERLLLALENSKGFGVA